MFRSSDDADGEAQTRAGRPVAADLAGARRAVGGDRALGGAVYDPPARTGRKRIDARAALDAVVYRLRSGVQWNQLPKEFPDDSSVHRTFQRWVRVGLFTRIWAALVAVCDELGGVDWAWQAADAAMGKARMGDLVGPNRTDRGKNGVKKSLLTEASGGPLAVVVAGANVHDTKLLAATPDAAVVDRPPPTAAAPQHLCLDKAYDNPTGHPEAAAHGYTPHIRRIGEEKLDERREKRYPARRWVVERTLAWLSKCRALLVRYDKAACNYLALLQPACALLWYRRYLRLAVSR
jgi:putative transposase